MPELKQPRRTDRADANLIRSDDLHREIPVRKPIAGESELASAVNTMVREGDLYEKLSDKRVHCFACAHHCKINDGGRGICQVRYNVGGTLFVPRGYVAALQCDPVEKKPFFHVLPSSDALTFGMLGCDLHCSYCFTGDTTVLTDRGPQAIKELFQSAESVQAQRDAEIAFPENLRAVAQSGQYRRVEAIFKHPYRGQLITLKPYYLPALRCTPEHRVYATDNPNRPPEKIQAQQLTLEHYLAIPRNHAFSTTQNIDIAQLLSERRVTYRVAWDLTMEQRQWIQEASAQGISSRNIGKQLGASASYIRHVRGKLRRGRGDDARTRGVLFEGEMLRFPNEHRPGIPAKVLLDEKLARLFGYYCAEGSVVQDKNRPNSFSLNFSFSHRERDLAEDVQSLLETCFGVTSSLAQRETTLAVDVSKASLAHFFKALCGTRATDKRVPYLFYDAPREIVEAFLASYALGDGHRYQNGKVSVTTSSTNLAYGVAWLALKCGHLASIYDAATSSLGFIMGRLVNRSPHQYSVVWYENSKVERRVIETPQYHLVPLREIVTSDFDGVVYNMQVEQEHNYLANFFLVSNCQNWDISQALRDPASGRPPSLVTPKQLVEIGREQNARVFASSYNEPLITSEWAVEIFKEATRAGFLCAYVSNGNATREVLEYIKPYVRAYKIDLKTMRDKNYRALGAPLQHILDGIKMVHELGFWLEIVTLVIPGFNDSPEELRDAAQFLASISRDIPWHVTAFHQDYKMLDKDSTSVRDLLRACEIGKEAGLNFVYAGNLPGRVGEWENTYCPNCHAALIERYGYLITQYRLTDEGTCINCDTGIPGIWHSDAKDARLGAPNLWQTRRPRVV